LIFPRGLSHVEPSSNRRSCDRPFGADIVPVRRGSAGPGGHAARLPQQVARMRQRVARMRAPPAIPDGRPRILRFTNGQRSSVRRLMSWSNRSMRVRSSTSRGFRFRPAFPCLVWRAWPMPTSHNYSGAWQNRWRRIRRRRQCFRSDGAPKSIPAAPIARSATFLSAFPRMSSTGASACSAATILEYARRSICTASSFAPCCRRPGKAHRRRLSGCGAF
jgi:hypothetical protein